MENGWVKKKKDTSDSPGPVVWRCLTPFIPTTQAYVLNCHICMITSNARIQDINLYYKLAKSYTRRRQELTSRAESRARARYVYHVAMATAGPAAVHVGLQLATGYFFLNMLR